MKQEQCRACSARRILREAIASGGARPTCLVAAIVTITFVSSAAGVDVSAMAAMVPEDDRAIVQPSLVPTPPEGFDPLDGCGKARMAAMMQPGEREGAPPEAYLETMGDTDVQHYALDIEITNIDPDGHTCTITGSNVMTIKSKSASLTEFSFRLRSQYVISNPTVGGTSVVVNKTSSTTRVVTLDRTYGMDESFTLTINYTGNTVSFRRSIGVDYQFDGVTPVVSTHSQPWFAHAWWPVKDGDVGLAGDNSDKATLELAVTVPDPMQVASNGLLQGTDVLSDSRTRYRWASDYPVPTYLVSFAATEYNTWTTNYNHSSGAMPVEFFIYPVQDTPDNRAGWDQVIDMLEAFRPLFGEYPFIDEKYGIYNAPFGGMEHQTITGQSGFGEWTTAHEVAHQWWGDLVTCKTWNHIWVNEGFGRYSEALWLEHKPGSTGLQELKDYMAILKPYTDGGSVYVYDDEVHDTGEIFNARTSYNKGGWVLHMLRHVLGDADFFDALAAFRAAYAFDAATTEDFQAVCEGFYGGSLNWFFQEWIYGVEWAPDYDWGWKTVQVNGQDYLLVHIDQVHDTSEQLYIMPIDIVTDAATYVVFNDTDPEHFVIPVPSTPGSVDFDPDAWILWGGVNELPYVAGPPTIVETAPAPGEEAAGTDTVTVWFHTNVNAAEGDFSLVGEVTGSRSFAIAAGANVNPVVLNLDEPLPVDAYILTVGTGVQAVDSGMALDGEVADAEDPQSLPSGDGEPGGAAVIRFPAGYAIPWHTVDGGGVMFAIGDGYKLGGTTGQHDAGTMGGDGYKLTGGFWVFGSTAAPVYPVLPADPPYDFRKNRYIAFNSNNTGAIVIQVQVAQLVCTVSGDACSYDEDCPDFAGGEKCHTPNGFDPVSAQADPEWEAVGWLGEPCSIIPGTQVPADTWHAMVVSNMPALPGFAYTDPATGFLLSTVFVADCEIMPRFSYGLRTSMNGSAFSERLVIGTIREPVKNAKKWADVVGQRDAGTGEYTEPNLRINVDDVQVMIVFLNSKSYRPHLTVLDLSHEVPGYKINADDLQMVMRAFSITEDYPPLKFIVEASGAVHPRDCPFDAVTEVHDKCE